MLRIISTMNQDTTIQKRWAAMEEVEDGFIFILSPGHKDISSRNKHLQSLFTKMMHSNCEQEDSFGDEYF